MAANTLDDAKLKDKHPIESDSEDEDDVTPADAKPLYIRPEPIMLLELPKQAYYVCSGILSDNIKFNRLN